MKKSQLLPLSLLIFLVISCHGHNEIPVSQEVPDVSAFKGKVSARVVCNSDTHVTYALYLPSYYDASRPWPLLIAFDSHADGGLPAGLLSLQAEKYGYVIAGSNNSKNGLPLEVSSGYFDAMLTDLTSRLNIDRKMIYTMGFSGGARVAVHQAVSRGGIRAVIGCGAGFPSQVTPPRTGFEYLGVVGSDDFNLLEMRQLMSSLDQTGIPHQLLVYDGNHAWPAGSILGDVFSWLQLRNMEDRLIPADTGWVNAVSADLDRRIEKEIKKKDWIAAMDLLQMAAGFFHGFPQAGIYQAAENKLVQQQEVKEAIRNRDGLLEKEEELHGQYLRYLGSKDPAWWKEETARLRKLITDRKGDEEAHMFQRLLSYLSLACYLNAKSSLAQQQADAFRYFATIYRIVDPVNAEAAYLLALSHMIDKQPEKAMESLQQAVELGFKDTARLRAETAFRPLMQQASMVKILSEIGPP